MNREREAIDYVNALRAYEKAEKPLKEFQRMTKVWNNQRNFRWAGIDLVMDSVAVDMFTLQLEHNLCTAKQTLEKAREALNVS